MIPHYVFVRVFNLIEVRRDLYAPRIINYYLLGWCVLVSAPTYIILRLWKGHGLMLGDCGIGKWIFHFNSPTWARAKRSELDV